MEEKIRWRKYFGCGIRRNSVEENILEVARGEIQVKQIFWGWHQEENIRQRKYFGGGRRRNSGEENILEVAGGEIQVKQIFWRWHREEKFS